MVSYNRLFGKPIQLKRFGCYVGNSPGMPIPPSVNLFVKVTDRCNAHCAFCSNGSQHNYNTAFDTDKLFRCVDEILSNRIILNRLNITGGEPSMVPAVVEEIIRRLEENERYKHIHLHLNTNGVQAESRELMKNKRWDSISISLHHYDSKRLAEIYRLTDIPERLRFEDVDMDKVNLSCNLIRGYIDTPEEAHKMLDFALDLGVPRIGFVGLMPVNRYCKERFVDLEDIHIDAIPHVYFTKSRNRGCDCKCSNYLYNRDLQILEIYMRNYMNPGYCESSLLFDGRHLRQGFNSHNIII